MNNPLVPQLRADKNGKLVTRHVTDSATSASLSSALPAPTLAVVQQKPEKTLQEIQKETSEALALRIFGEASDDPKSPYRNAVASMSWINTPLLENIMDALDNPPKYRTIISSASNLKHHLGMSKGFSIAMAASVHDIGTALTNAGFQNFQPPEVLCDSYFHRPTVKYVKDENIQDFRAVYLAEALELDADLHPDGKMAHYRDMTLLGKKTNEVIKALPILHTIIDDNDNMMVEDGVQDILMISEHAAQKTETEIERIAVYIRTREERWTYDPELIDEMLEQTTPAMSTGWL